MTRSVEIDSQRGFTLVELMVVVAIIGLLSAVAIPNFKKYQAKSKIAEAKIHLATVYTAEASFFSNYNMYAGCLKYMGYDPEQEKSNRYYAVGFINLATIHTVAYDAAISSGLNSQDCPKAATSTGRSYTDLGTSYYLAGKGIGSMIANTTDIINSPVAPLAAVGDQSSSSAMTFTAGAIGYFCGQTYYACSFCTHYRPA